MNFKNFKLKGIHIFVILLGALLLVSLLRPIMEGFDNNDNNDNNNNNVDIPSFLESVSEKTGNLINSVESKLTPSNGVNNNRDVSYVGPAGDTVLVDNPRQPMQPIQQPMQPTQPMQPQSLGIPKSQIPEGSEDLYILKSQVVPPVCPACPTVSACPRPAPYPPCPPCARCPEPAFDCKKVPNYKSENTYLPRPVLADFSQFGM